ncbi:hypothetical protein NRP93_002374 [Clostridium botulinum]|nr:hypothetical protein [Clostridium botulinum]
MSFLTEFKDKLKEYRDLGKDDIFVEKYNIIITLDEFHFSINKLKNSVVKYLNHEGFKCIDTGKDIWGSPILEIYGEKFRLTMSSGAGSSIIPVQHAVLIPLYKENK